MNKITKLICLAGLAIFSLGAAPAAEPSVAPAPEAPKVVRNITGTITAMPAGAAKSAVVYLEDAPVGTAVPATVTNSRMEFSPYIAVTTPGAKVTFSNVDPFPHNVFTTDHEQWNLGTIPGHSSKTKTFNKPETYTLLCNLHPNMKGYLVVVPNSYFGKSDSKGNFTIKDVPAPGTYKITAWAPGVKPVSQSVVITTGDTVVNFDLHR